MIYILIIVLVLILFILSRSLSRLISQLLYTVSRSQKATIYFIAMFFFPGVVVHEISHYLMAQLLFVPTGKIEFMPVLRGTELKLGSVQIAKTDPFRRALVGVAPFLFGVSIILTALFFYQQLPFIPENLRSIVVGYLIFQIGNTMFSSKKDLEGTIELFLTCFIIGVILYFIGVRVPLAWIDYFFTDQMLVFMRQVLFFIAIPVGIDVILILFLRLILRFTRLRTV